MYVIYNARGHVPNLNNPSVLYHSVAVRYSADSLPAHPGLPMLCSGLSNHRLSLSSCRRIFSRKLTPEYPGLGLPAGYVRETGQQPERSVPTGRTMKGQWGCRVTFGHAPPAYGPTRRPRPGVLDMLQDIPVQS